MWRARASRNGKRKRTTTAPMPFCFSFWLKRFFPFRFRSRSLICSNERVAGITQPIIIKISLIKIGIQFKINYFVCSSFLVDFVSQIDEIHCVCCAVVMILMTITIHVSLVELISWHFIKISSIAILYVSFAAGIYLRSSNLVKELKWIEIKILRIHHSYSVNCRVIQLDGNWKTIFIPGR